MLCLSSWLSSCFIIQIHYEGSEFHYHPTTHPLVTRWGPRGPWRGVDSAVTGHSWLFMQCLSCRTWRFPVPAATSLYCKVCVRGCVWDCACLCVCSGGLRVSPSGNRAKKQTPPPSGRMGYHLPWCQKVKRQRCCVVSNASLIMQV